MTKNNSKSVPQDFFLQVLEATDIPHDIFLMLMEQCATKNYFTLYNKMRGEKDIYAEQLRLVSMNASFELVHIKNTIHSIKKQNTYYEQYTVECSAVGMPLCKNVFLTQSPTRFGMWMPTAPNLQTLYREMKKAPQIDATHAPTAAHAILKYYLKTK